jgi:hypothetical protein
MNKYLVLSMLAMLGSTILLLSFFVATSALAQDDPYSEEYMQQHDGGDRAEVITGREDDQNLLDRGRSLRPSPQILSNPLTPLNLLRIPVCQVEVVQSSVDSDANFCNQCDSKIKV